MADIRSKGGVESDIYTAMLGLAFLALAATTGVVCYVGYQYYGTIFGLGV